MVFVHTYKINQNLGVGRTHPAPSARVYLVVYVYCHVFITFFVQIHYYYQYDYFKEFKYGIAITQLMRNIKKASFFLLNMFLDNLETFLSDMEKK